MSPILEPEYLVLRPEVAVTSDGAGGVRVNFALWEVSFPREAVRAVPSLSRLLTDRRISRFATDMAGASVMELLAAQGCFLPALGSEIRLKDVVSLFQPIRSHFYAQYYAHPVWKRLRSGAASRGELTAWIIHNYHISRSAGTIAARMATHATQPHLRAFFREDALEEFWHCDEFYFASRPELPLHADSVKAYIPLAASTAFEDQALRAADDDWLGHLLIAYFQESSILFRDDSEGFYDAVERAYGLDGFFVGWRRHMALDLDHGHADGLRDLFTSDQTLSMNHVVRSVRNVQLAHFFLMRALDQIAAHVDVADPIGLRQPAEIAPQTFVRFGLTGDATNTTELSKRSDGLYLAEALGDAAYRALAFARVHDDIIAAGRLAAAIANLIHLDASMSLGEPMTVNGTVNPWLIAVRNFIIERAMNVRVLLELSRELLAKLARYRPDLVPALTEVETERMRLESRLQSAGTAPLEKIQLRELLDLACGNDELPPLVLGLLSDGEPVAPNTLAPR